MAIHNLTQYGPMKMKIVKTSVYLDINKAIEEHEFAIDKFNAEHNVFFNQETKFQDIGTSCAFIYSVILYAELKQQFSAVQLPKQGGMN